jgi:Domain of unknown function (DUF6321)/Family of unknown function (DUF5824)
MLSFDQFLNTICETADAGLAAKASKSGISIGTLRKVYRRGVAAWNSGHRPGTTPQQWGMARVNSYITHGSGTYGGADKDLHEGDTSNLPRVAKDKESGLPKKYVAGLSASTAKARAAHWNKMDKKSDSDPSAYEPAPGDATAKTKESKHTKKYHAMYGESMEEEILEAVWDGDIQVDIIGLDENGLWDNIHAKQQRIKNGSGEHMRKPGSKGAPTSAALKSANEAANFAQQAAIAIAMKKAGKKPKETNEELKGGQKKLDKNHNGVIDGQDFAILRNKKTKNEEVEAQFDLIESVVNELALLHNIDPEVLWERFEEFTDEQLLEYAVDAKGHKSSTGGLTQKGRDAYNAHGAHLQAPVTTPPSKLKAGSKAANRRKSFCARMGGMEGPMKKPNGKPTRKALALRKWNC